MTVHGGRLLAVLGLVLLIVAGCSTVTPSAPITAPTTSAERYGAPEVGSPRALGALATSPCGLLTAADRRSLQLTVPPSMRQGALGVVDCVWTDRTSKQYVALGPITGRDYLVDVYRTRQYRIFEPTTVGGLPAVRQQTDRNSTACSLTVGLSSDQALNGQYDELEGERSGQACDRLQRIVELAVAKVPPAK